MKPNKELAIRLISFCTVMLISLQSTPYFAEFSSRWNGHSIGLFGKYDNVKKITRIILTLLPISFLIVVSFIYGLFYYFIISYIVFYATSIILKKYNRSIMHFDKAYLCTLFSIGSYSFILYHAFIGNYIFGLASVMLLTLVTAGKVEKKILV